MKRGRVYNHFYTEELWEQVNPKNKRIMKDFIAEYKQQKKSPNTIAQYTYDLRIIFIYILKELDNQCILDLNRKDFRAMSIYFTDECNLSANRTNRIRSTCNSLLTFCEFDDDYDYEVNQSKKVKGVKREIVKDNDDDFFFTFDEFLQVRNILIERGEKQLAAFWSLAFDSAGRRSELAQIKKKNILNGNKTNVVVGKRGKKFPLIFLDDTKQLIADYLEERGEDDIDALWTIVYRGERRPATADILYTWVVKISDILSDIRHAECNIFPHTIRHSRLECLSQGTDTRLIGEDGEPIKYPLDKIQIFAHHSDIGTTQGYLKNHDDETIQEMFGLES